MRSTAANAATMEAGHGEAVCHRSGDGERDRGDAHLRRLRLQSKEFIVERLYRDAPLLVIGEGTNEMQRMIIAKRLIERNRI